MTWRAWLLLRRGDLQGAAGDARTVLEASDLPAPQLYRTVATGVLVTALTDQGDLEAAEAALRALRPGPAGADAQRRRCCCSRAGACVRRSAGSTPALADMRAAGDIAVRIGRRSRPPRWPGARTAALVQLALGEREPR